MISRRDLGDSTSPAVPQSSVGFEKFGDLVRAKVVMNKMIIKWTDIYALYLTVMNGYPDEVKLRCVYNINYQHHRLTFYAFNKY